MSPTVRAVCPECGAPVAERAEVIRCLGDRGCGQTYPRLGRVPVLLPRPRAWWGRWTRELAALERQGAAELAAVEATLVNPDVLPATAARCRAMLQGARDQAAELAAVMGPLLAAEGGGDRREGGGQPLASPLARLHYLVRDWGWDGGRHPENARAVADVAEVAEGKPLGRTIVLGAGGGRLAYDLRAQLGATEVVALDVDPVLMVFAAAIAGGETLSLTETASPVYEAASVARRWELAAPDGAAPVEELQFLLADGLAPPFAPGSFDTVVTPWFIDHVPRDLRDFLGTAARLLAPGGRWINRGPLIYPGEVPPARRFTREEIFELAARAGFTVGRWTTSSIPHLVSPLYGRGRTEWTLTFAAAAGAPAADMAGPPSWLVLPWLPVPWFTGQSLFWNENPLIAAVVAAIDGQRSVDDIARALVPQVREMGLDPSDLKEAVRQCLAAVHPACQA